MRIAPNYCKHKRVTPAGGTPHGELCKCLDCGGLLFYDTIKKMRDDEVMAVKTHGT